LKIAFIGMPCSGKTTVATRLSKLCNLPMYDTDDIIAKKYNATINQIFKKHGEEYFRVLECHTIKDLSTVDKGILSLGGGAILNPFNMKLLNSFFIIWLDCNCDCIFQRMTKDCGSVRPLIKNIKDIQDLYQNRIDKYQRYANHTIDTTQYTVEQVVKEIVNILNLQFYK